MKIEQIKNVIRYEYACKCKIDEKEFPLYIVHQKFNNGFDDNGNIKWDIVKMPRFKHLSNKQLVDTINKRSANGLNDDDYVYELFRRRDEQGFKVIPKWDTYEIIE